MRRTATRARRDCCARAGVFCSDEMSWLTRGRARDAGDGEWIDDGDGDGELDDGVVARGAGARVRRRWDGGECGARRRRGERGVRGRGRACKREW